MKCRPIDIMVRVFGNGLGDRSPYQKPVLDTSLLNT